MANLVAMNIKRKDAEVASHGFSIFFVDPKRIKLQDAAEIPEMMEEEKTIAGADAAAPTMFMPSLLLPTQGQGAAVHDTKSVRKSSSEPPLSADQAAPMDVEEDVRKCQPQPQPIQGPHFFTGFF
ncbi:hypothetical protein U9M48_040376 [Paspalum notatum var. saurae]|uniref:Uncharacterized protein n=1 Tax=Paspalum notatum var. saurae TaxID=547442 RepID=A0AAQ3UMQ9_PASNO